MYDDDDHDECVGYDDDGNDDNDHNNADGYTYADCVDDECANVNDAYAHCDVDDDDDDDQVTSGMMMIGIHKMQTKK